MLARSRSLEQEAFPNDPTQDDRDAGSSGDRSDNWHGSFSRMSFSQRAKSFLDMDRNREGSNDPYMSPQDALSPSIQRNQRRHAQSDARHNRQKLKNVGRKDSGVIDVNEPNALYSRVQKKGSRKDSRKMVRAQSDEGILDQDAVVYDYAERVGSPTIAEDDTLGDFDDHATHRRAGFISRLMSGLKRSKSQDASAASSRRTSAAPSPLASQVASPHTSHAGTPLTSQSATPWSSPPISRSNTTRSYARIDSDSEDDEDYKNRRKERHQKKKKQQQQKGKAASRQASSKSTRQTLQGADPHEQASMEEDVSDHEYEDIKEDSSDGEHMGTSITSSSPSVRDGNTTITADDADSRHALDDQHESDGASGPRHTSAEESEDVFVADSATSAADKAKSLKKHFQPEVRRQAGPLSRRCPSGDYDRLTHEDGEQSEEEFDFGEAKADLPPAMGDRLAQGTIFNRLVRS